MSTELPKDAIEALRKGNKIEAIKCARRALNLDLVGAKDLVEAFLLTNTDVNTQYISESKKQSNGCLPIFLVLFTLIAGVIIYFVHYSQ